jgi:hypothetical protein
MADTKSKNFNLGFFLKKYHVDKALLLIQKQLEEKSFTFKSIDFEIYRKEKSLEEFDSTKFYEDFIEKDLLYNYRSLFYNYEYNVPKGTYGIRKFNFTSFHLFVLYYSLGYYIYEVLNDTLSRLETAKKEMSNIKTFYGGHINYTNPKKSEIYYQKDYSAFNKSIKENVKNGLEKGKKVCIVKLDIQDYYGNIKTRLLLDIIEKYGLPSTKKKFHFNNSTKESIANLLLFYNKQECGLPLSNQNIFSNFLSYIFLFELDNFIQTLSIYEESGFSYFRYVDDFYLIFERDKDTRNDIIGNEIFELSTLISDFLSNELSLSINHLKSQKWIIETKNDFKDFLIKEKFISFTDIFNNEDSKTQKPSEKLEEICQIIEMLKKDFILKGKTEIDTHQDITLKEVFISSIKDYVKSDDAQKKLESSFKDWNPILTLNSVKALMFLIGNSKTGYSLVKSYLEKAIATTINKTQNIYLLEKFLNLEQYDRSLDITILAIKDSKSLYFSLIQRMILGSKDIKRKYLPIDDLILKENDSLTQQIKMMVLAEEEGKFNLAFSHLLNVFHLYCYIKDTNKEAKELKKYDQNNIVSFLTQQKTSIEEINFVMSFFDRRNKNNISHPGENLMENWVVNENEYIGYCEKMVKLIERKIK